MAFPARKLSGWAVALLALAWASAASAQSLGYVHVATNASLQATSIALYPHGVWRDGYAAAGDAPPLFYLGQASPCSLGTAGAGDGGSQVKSADGGCWMASFPAVGADVREFGAKCRGNLGVDDSGAINRALAGALTVVLPGGTCVAAGTINIGNSQESLTGQGIGASTIKSTSANAPVIKTVAGITNFTLSGFSVDRSVVATAGGNGIDITSGTVDAVISNVQAQNQWIGFALGPAAYGQVTGCNAFSNYSDGFQFTDTSANQTAQWAMLNDLAQTNEGFGYQAIAPASALMIMLPWVNVESFANNAGGVAFGWNGAGKYADISIMGGVFSTDNGNELFFSNIVENLQIGAEAFVELAGMQGAGRNFAHPATHVGTGIYTSGSVGDLSVGAVTVYANSQYGIYTGAFRTQVTGAKVLQNSQAAANTFAGIDIQNTTAGATALVSGTISGNLNTNSPQANGLVVQNAQGATITGNDFCFNQGAPIQIGSNFTSGASYGNICANTTANGTASIPAGQTSVVVSHGLINTPGTVIVTPGSPASGLWVDTITATQFTIHIPAALGASLVVMWAAKFMNF